MPTCVLVETGETDPIVSVAQMVGELIGDSAGALAKDCGALLEAGKLADAVSKGALPKCTSIIYLNGNPGDSAPVQKALAERAK